MSAIPGSPPDGLLQHSQRHAPSGENQIMERGQLLRSARSIYSAVGSRQTAFVPGSAWDATLPSSRARSDSKWQPWSPYSRSEI